MHKSVIEKFFDHVLERQTAQGPERAFRFKGIKASDGRVSPAHYPNHLNNPSPTRHITKRTGRPNANPDPGSSADAEADADADDAADAAGPANAPSATQPHAKSRGRLRSQKTAKGKSKAKQTGRISTAKRAHNPEPPNSSQLTNTTQSGYVQVNQTAMDILCTAGVPRPQPINGPADGEPEYLISRDMYARYITHLSLRKENANNEPCPIDPLLLEGDHTAPPQARSQRPKPRPRFKRNETKDLAAVASNDRAGMDDTSLQGITPLPHQPLSESPQLPHTSGSMPSASASVLASAGTDGASMGDDTSLQGITPLPHQPLAQSNQLPQTSATTPSASASAVLINQSEALQLSDQAAPGSIHMARRTRRTADDLAQQEAISTQVHGRRQRTRKLNFAQ